MMRLRQFIKQNPIAAVAIVGGLLVAGAWRGYLAVTAPAPVNVRPATPAATAPPRAPAAGTAAQPPGPSGESPAGTTASGVKPAPTASPPGTGAAPAAGAPGAPDSGRDPFRSPIQPGRAPGGTGLPLPPVPPLSPGGLPLPGESVPAQPLAPTYRVAGIIRDAVALAILEDGTRSYVVEAGDELRPGVRVTVIDVSRGIVQLMQGGTPTELRLGGGGKVP